MLSYPKIPGLNKRLELWPSESSGDSIFCRVGKDSKWAPDFGKKDLGISEIAIGLLPAHLVQVNRHLDPLGQPTVTTGRDHGFRTCCPSVRCHFWNLAKQNKETMFATGRDCGSGWVDHWWHLSCLTYI